MADLFYRWGVFLAVLAGSVLLRSNASADEPPKQKPTLNPEAPDKYCETILKHFKRPTDTASLLAYLKEKSPSDDDLLAIPALIKQLGSDKFAERTAASKKLVEIGLPAFMPLLDAMHDRDPERARLAKATIEMMDRGTHTVSVPPVTIRLLMKRKPPELFEVLLRYLPWTTDPEVEEDIYYDIDELAVVEGKVDAKLVQSLEDRIPARRALAGCIVARAGTVEQKQTARKLLNDPDPNVRLRTAQGFLAGLDKGAIPTLIEMLAIRPIHLAWQAEELLMWAAWQSAPKQLVWAGGDRATIAKQSWSVWWKENCAKVDLIIASERKPRPCMFRATNGTHFIGSDGGIRWEIQQSSRSLSQVIVLPNDRLVQIDLVPAPPFDHHVIFHYTTVSGTKIWVKKLTTESLFDVTRHALAANGAIRCFGSNVIGSIGLEGKLLTRVTTAEAAGNPGGRGAAAPYACTDGLVWIHFGPPNAMLLMDPNDGTVINKWLFENKPEISGRISIFPFNDGQVFFTTKFAIWLFDFKSLRRINEVDFQKYDLIAGMCPLREYGYAVYNGREIVYLTRDWKIRTQVKTATSFPYETINQFLPLVGFGFR